MGYAMVGGYIYMTCGESTSEASGNVTERCVPEEGRTFLLLRQ